MDHPGNWAAEKFASRVSSDQPWNHLEGPDSTPPAAGEPMSPQRSVLLSSILALLACRTPEASAANQAPEALAASHTHLEQDCNGNGIEDSVDISFGSSSDENANGVPDECEESRIVAQRP